MISLEVEDYCNNCTEFEPDIDRVSECTFYDGEEMPLVETIITCAHKCRCASLYGYLKEISKKKGDKNEHIL